MTPDPTTEYAEVMPALDGDVAVRIDRLPGERPPFAALIVTSIQCFYAIEDYA